MAIRESELAAEGSGVGTYLHKVSAFAISAGIVSVAFGIILLLQPAAGALALVWLIAAWAVVFGILLMIVAFRMRNWKGVITLRTAEI